MRRPLVVAAGAFVCFGVFWGSWAVATTDVEHYTGLSNAGLGLLLPDPIAAGGLAAAAAGRAMSAIGPRPPASRPPGSLGPAARSPRRRVPDKVAFVAVFALAVASAGLVDMAMNTAATVGLGGSAGGDGPLPRAVQRRNALRRGARGGSRLGERLVALDVARDGLRPPSLLAVAASRGREPTAGTIADSRQLSTSAIAASGRTADSHLSKGSGSLLRSFGAISDAGPGPARRDLRDHRRGGGRDRHLGSPLPADAARHRRAARRRRVRGRPG